MTDVADNGEHASNIQPLEMRDHFEWHTVVCASGLCDLINREAALAGVKGAFVNCRQVGFARQSRLAESGRPQSLLAARFP